MIPSEQIVQTNTTQLDSNQSQQVGAVYEPVQGEHTKFIKHHMTRGSTGIKWWRRWLKSADHMDLAETGTPSICIILFLVLHAIEREARHVKGGGKLLDLALEVLDVFVVHQALGEVLEQLAVLLLDFQADRHSLVEELGNLLEIFLDQTP
jgi:hypothetical protein